MKPKLPCCEINKKTPDTIVNLECDHCECVFGEKDQLDDHKREIHQVQIAGKRKMACCEQNVKWKKPNEIHHNSCKYCECTFQKKHQVRDHIGKKHQCQDCFEIVLTEEIRAQHKIKHEEEKRQKEELKKQQQQKDDDLVLNYVKTNKLDEYQRDPDYEPDIEYIVYEKDLSKEELLRFVKKFEVEDILAYTSPDPEVFSSEEITFLLENDALSVENVASFMNGFTLLLGEDEIMSELVSYFLDKGYDIEREWVAKVIEDDALIERIKQKYTYTFNEIYDAREKTSIFNKEKWDCFYVQVHKHFPNPEFEDPFADPYIDFECIATEHVHDHLQNRYFYDEEEDELFIVIHSRSQDREIPLGSCKEMLNEDLQALIDQYHEAIEDYKEANKRVSELFDEFDEELHDGLTETQELNVLDHYDHELYKDALPDRNYYANKVSKLYFVIAKK